MLPYFRELSLYHWQTGKMMLCGPVCVGHWPKSNLIQCWQSSPGERDPTPRLTVLKWGLFNTVMCKARDIVIYILKEHSVLHWDKIILGLGCTNIPSEQFRPIGGDTVQCHVLVNKNTYICQIDKIVWFHTWQKIAVISLAEKLLLTLETSSWEVVILEQGNSATHDWQWWQGGWSLHRRLWAPHPHV